MIKIKFLLFSLIALPLASNAQVEKIVESYDNGQIKSITYENKETGLLEGHCVSIWKMVAYSWKKTIRTV